MSTAELRTITDNDTILLRSFDRNGCSADDYTNFKDVLAGEVAAGSGRCDEGTFLRAFWPELQRGADGYTGSSPCEVTPTLNFAHFIERNVGHVVAGIDIQEHPALPRVKIDRIGLIVGDATTGSPLQYTIEEFDEITDEAASDDEPTGQFYLGRVAARVLWTPDTHRARRRSDITADYIEHIPLLEVERTEGEASTDIVIAHTSFEDLGLMVGVMDIVKSIRNRELAAERILDQSQRALRGAAQDIGMHI